MVHLVESVEENGTVRTICGAPGSEFDVRCQWDWALLKCPRCTAEDDRRQQVRRQPIDTRFEGT